VAVVEIRSPVDGSIVGVPVTAGQSVRPGDVLAVVEAMKMEHEIRSDQDADVVSVRGRVGEVVGAGELLLVLRAGTAVAAGSPADAADVPASAAETRADLQELRAREAWLADANRPDAVAKRRARGLRTARENVADLCDPGSFVEYGALAIAAQRSRRSLDDLIRNTPADGMVTGIGTINGTRFAAERTRAVVMAYDATVLAGTQGMRNHQKTDRMLGIAAAQGLPVVLFAEGGGAGRATSTCRSSPASTFPPSRASPA
jgi:pyruvate carboxylase